VMKAEIPATIPASIVSAKAGLAAISAKIVPPAGTDLYNEFVNDVLMINNSGIAKMSPTDHLPNVVFGIILQGCFVILSSFLGQPNRLISKFINLLFPILLLYIQILSIISMKPVKRELSMPTICHFFPI